MVVTFSKMNNQLSMRIEDDGRGFDVKATGGVYNGNGMKNMKSRADEINASLDVRSVPGSGTVIELLCDV